MNPNINLCFDNRGGLIIRFGENYEHSYDNMKQAATYYVEFIKNESTEDWEGNEKGIFPEYDYNQEHNGGAKWYNYNEFEKKLCNYVLGFTSGWYNFDEFCEAVSNLIKEENHKN